MDHLDRKVAVVSGGAGALGGAIVEALAASDHDVGVLDRTGEFACDLADKQDVERVASAVLERRGRCDVFVHAAGAFDTASLADLELDTWRHVQAVNVESALWLSQAFTPGMIERGFGRIILIVSDTFFNPPFPELLPYIASKGALIGVARSLARSLGESGITVNCVAPGLTRTPAAEEVVSPKAFASVLKRQALPRSLLPHDTADTVAFLASDAAAALTGQTLCPDGGLIVR